MKVYQGEWADDQPRCGEFRHPNEEEELRFVRPLPKGVFHNKFQLPSLTLADSDKVLDVAVSEVRMNSLNKSHSATRLPQNLISKVALEAADAAFNRIAQEEGTPHAVSIYHMGEVLLQLGLNLTEADIRDIVEQLEVKDTMEVSFSEAVEIATFIHEQKMESEMMLFP